MHGCSRNVNPAASRIPVQSGTPLPTLTGPAECLLWRQAHELSLRVPHLALRMREHSTRAQFLAEHLEKVCGSL